jgi:hypothetical protein
LPGARGHLADSGGQARAAGLNSVLSVFLIRSPPVATGRHRSHKRRSRILSRLDARRRACWASCMRDATSKGTKAGGRPLRPRVGAAVPQGETRRYQRTVSLLVWAVWHDSRPTLGLAIAFVSRLKVVSIGLVGVYRASGFWLEFFRLYLADRVQPGAEVDLGRAAKADGLEPLDVAGPVAVRRDPQSRPSTRTLCSWTR